MEVEKVTAVESGAKKPKKPIYKRWWFWLVIVVVIVAATRSGSGEKSGAESAEADAAPETQQAAEPAVESTLEVEESAEPEAVSFDLDTCISLIRLSLANAYGDNFSITQPSDNVVMANVWGDSVAAGAVLARAGNQEALDAWGTLTDNLKALSRSYQDILNENGHDNVILSVNVLNDQNKDNVLLSVVSGIVVVDVVNSGES